jgi:hypothetical protein
MGSGVECTDGAEIANGGLPTFDVPLGDDETLIDHEQAVVLELASVTFAERNTWGFFDGSRKPTRLWRARTSSRA